MKYKDRSDKDSSAELRAKVTELFNAGYSNALIAFEVGETPAVVARLRKLWGLVHENLGKGKSWTKEEDATIIRMRGEGKTGTEIAAALGRSYGAYAGRMKVLKSRGEVEALPSSGKALRPEDLDEAGIDHQMFKKLKKLRIGSGSIDRNFSMRDMVKMFKEQRGLCYYTQLPLKSEPGFNGQNLSLDRVDSTKNYTYENTVMCCSQVNKMKGSMTLEEFDWWIDRLVAGREA